MGEDDWKYACLDCGGKGYEEKLSCGCTGYRMRRSCKTCNSRGTVDLLTHNIQVNEQRKFFDCTKNFTKNKQDFLS